MSLDLTKLAKVCTRDNKTTAQCPACAEDGHDKKGEHLVIYPRGRFACVLYPGDSADAKEHRKRIFALCGDREIKPLAVCPAGLGRVGRVNQSQSAEPPLKTGLLGRLGRVFETHVERKREPTGDKEHNPEHRLNDCGKGVLAVLSDPTVTHRQLSERERILLMRWCGTDDAPIIIEAINLFNAQIVGIEQQRARAGLHNDSLTPVECKKIAHEAGTQ